MSADQPAPAGSAAEPPAVRVLDGPGPDLPQAAVTVTAAWTGPPEAAARVVAAALADAVGEPLPVVARPGPRPGTVVVSAGWRTRGAADAIAATLTGLLDRTVAASALALAVEQAGDQRRPAARDPAVPAVGVTGTNGKTTTTRLLAHLARTAGYRPGWCTTDGIWVDGVEVERGDWSGPGGAARVLDHPVTSFAVLEAARGGMLRRGLGVTRLDVAVVTNVSADHLGQGGVHTLDDLARVKAAVVRVVPPTGWVVLNGEDPRAWAMAALTPARPWAFALDPRAPAVARALAAGGRAMVLDRGRLVARSAAGDAPLVDADRVPLTLGGLARHGIANALAAAAAGLAAGLPRSAVAEGLVTFPADAEANPGRLNVYALGSATVVLDLAHNEAGLAALLDVADRLRAPAGRTLLVVGTAGDRQDDALHALGALAAARADVVARADKDRYRRGRDPGELPRLIAAGMASAGPGRAADAGAFPDERAAVTALLDRLAPGDVLAVCSHEQRPQIVADLTARGARPVEPGRVGSEPGRVGRAEPGRVGRAEPGRVGRAEPEPPTVPLPA